MTPTVEVAGKSRHEVPVAPEDPIRVKFDLEGGWITRRSVRMDASQTGRLFHELLTRVWPSVDPLLDGRLGDALEEAVMKLSQYLPGGQVMLRLRSHEGEIGAAFGGVTELIFGSQRALNATVIGLIGAGCGWSPQEREGVG